MSSKQLRIISVGALKTPHWKEAAAHYLKRLKPWRNVDSRIVKDGDSALPIIKRNFQEGQKIITAINPKDYIIGLDEHGKTFSSKAFATFLQDLQNRTPCFIIGGAFGLDDAVKKSCNLTLALGPMTLPHELAHVLLLEQLYRAEAILHNIPYHHE